MMNPETNQFEPVQPPTEEQRELFRKMTAVVPDLVKQDGTPVPPQNPVFSVGETFDLKGYRFKVAEIQPDKLILEPVGPGNRTVQRKGLNPKRPRKRRRRKS
jgi:hypothetical protein